MHVSYVSLTRACAERLLERLLLGTQVRERSGQARGVLEGGETSLTRVEVSRDRPAFGRASEATEVLLHV